METKRKQNENKKINKSEKANMLRSTALPLPVIAALHTMEASELSQKLLPTSTAIQWVQGVRHERQRNCTKYSRIWAYTAYTRARVSIIERSDARWRFALFVHWSLVFILYMYMYVRVHNECVSCTQIFSKYGSVLRIVTFSKNRKCNYILHVLVCVWCVHHFLCIGSVMLSLILVVSTCTCTVRLTRDLNVSVEYEYSCSWVKAQALSNLLASTPYLIVVGSCTLKHWHAVGLPLTGAKQSCIYTMYRKSGNFRY